MKNTQMEELLKVLMVASKDKALLKAFIEDLFTPKELEEIPTRWQIVKRISKGEPHSKIAKELHIGVGTVTRGSVELKDKKGGFAQMLKKISK